MARRLVCICGQKMEWQAGQEGKQLRCPNCHARLRIPTADEDRTLVRWHCRCGQRLKARRRSGGRSMKCPRCLRSNTVPIQEGQTALADSEELEPPDASDDHTLPDIEGPLAPVRSSESDTTQVELPPDDTMIELPVVGPSDAAHSTVEEGAELAPILEDNDSGEYALSGPSWPVPIPPRTPPAEFQHPVPSPEEDESEGIRASELRRYFNVRDGADAARAGVMQLLNGYWLFIPYALLSASMLRLLALLLPEFKSEPLAALLVSIGYAAFSLFLWAGFIVCIKDGIFERAFGIERLVVGGAVQFPRFAGTVLLLLPVAVGLVIIASLLFGALWGTALLPGKIALVVGAALFGLFMIELFLVPPVLAVAENLGPFVALGRGLNFTFRQFKELLTMNFVSLIVGTGVGGIVASVYYMVRPLLAFLPVWLFRSIQDLSAGLMATAVLGQIVASLMLLYLSQIKEEERLIRIRQRLSQVEARPWLTFLVIAMGLATLLLLDYGLFRRSGDFEPESIESRVIELNPGEPPLAPGFPRGLPLPPSEAP